MGAKVHYVKAAKDYPDFGVKKGDMHYTWALFRSKPRRSKIRPTRSQLENSEFKSTYYALVDATLPDLVSADDLRDLADQVRELGEGERSRVDDLPENFRDGEQGDRLNNRGDELDTWADELEAAADELGSEEDWEREHGVKDDAPGDPADDYTYADAVKAAIEDLAASAPDPE